MFSGKYDPRLESAWKKERVSDSLPSRHPFQVLMLAATSIGGGCELFGIAHITSVNQALPRFLVLAWSLFACFGGLLSIGSAWLPDRAAGLIIERAGLIAVGSASAVYGAVLASRGPSTAAVVIAWCIGLVLACGWRAYKVSRELAKMEWFLTQGHE